MKKALIGLFPDEIVQLCSLNKLYQGTQIFEAVFQGHKEIKDITTLPKDLREDLSKKYALYSSKLVETQDDYSAAKIKIQLSDRAFIEAVLLKDGKDRLTACLSAQVGCKMACAFCRTGEMGFQRDLDAGEIIEQFLFLSQNYGKISNIVFMGMGEALDNYSAVKKAIDFFCHPKAFALSRRRITISTVGMADEIQLMPTDFHAVRLAVSLVSALPECRQRLMPISKRYNLSYLKKSLLAYQGKQNKRITLEWVLLKGINDSLEEIHALRKWCTGLNIMINLIPWNPVDSMAFQAADDREVEAFRKQLVRYGFNVNVRQSKGSNIKGACGQLATSEPNV